MYRCEVCGQVVSPGTPAVKRVVETRERQYPLRGEATTRNHKTKVRGRRHAGDPGGHGREIVREQLVCPACRDSEGLAGEVSAADHSM
jgi:rubredoxin